MQLSEHRHNLKEDLLEKSELAQHAYEEGWDNARNLEMKSISRYRKYKEMAHMAYLIRSGNPVWTFLPSGSPISAMELQKHRGLYDVTGFYSWRVSKRG
jgi:hypothetical protein